MSKPIIKLDDTRSKLIEGRSSGIGFAFLKQVKPGEFEGVQPISPCKDYMNDVVYSEHTGKPFRVWGLSTTKRDIFDTHAYVAFASTTGNKYDTKAFIEKEVKLFKENFANLLGLVNAIEKAMGFKEFTEMVQVEDNLVFAKIPLEWVKTTWATSLWGFIVRNAIHATDFSDPIESFQKAVDATMEDSMYFKTIKKVLPRIFKDGFPEQDLLAGNFSIHDEGIIAYCNKAK
jgi:hypothetical protein